MALWATQLAGIETTIGALTGTSLLAVVTTSGTANTMGSWTQLVAATPYDTHSLSVTQRFDLTANTNQSRLMDIGVGGVGSERVVVPKIVFGYNSAGLPTFHIPFFIPAGSAISMRTQANNTSGTAVPISTLLNYSAGLPAMCRATEYGVLTASSGGTALFNGTLAANTKSSWTQLVASTTYPIRCLMAMSTPPNQTVGNMNTTVEGLIDIGVGGSGSEVVVISNIQTRTVNGIHRGTPATVWVDIPAGSRIAARWQTAVTNPSNLQSPRVAVIGFG